MAQANPIMSRSKEDGAGTLDGVSDGRIVSPQLLVAEAPVESTTLDVKLKEAPAVGVPVIAPVDAFSVKPGGKLPALIEYVNGPTPPVAVSADE